MNGAEGSFLRSVWRSAGAALTAALGLTATAEAQPQRLAPEAAPPEWVAYAETATQAVTSWLEGEAAAGVRLSLDRTRPAADQPTPPLELKLWIDGSGMISRAGFASLDDAEADAEVRAALEGRRLASPPEGMLQPLRLEIQLAY